LARKLDRKNWTLLNSATRKPSRLSLAVRSVGGPPRGSLPRPVGFAYRPG